MPRMIPSDWMDRLSDNVFRGDFASRYNFKRAGTIGGTPYLFPGADSYQKVKPFSKQKEIDFHEDISEGPDKTVASWVWNFNQLETRMMALANRGRFAEAQAMYRQINDIIDENFDEILDLTRAGTSGPLGEQLAERASHIANGDFGNTPVNFMGQQMPLSSVVQDGGELAASRARDEFESIGLSGHAADMLFSGSDRQRAVMKSLVYPLLGGQDVPDKLQRVDLAESLVDNWDDYELVFGEGLPYIVDRIQSAHTGSGGAADTMKTLTEYARTVGAARGLEGRALAKDVMSAYNGLVTQAFASDADPQGGPSKGSVQSRISPSRRMAFDAALASAVKALSARGVSADLKAPAFANALNEVLDAQAYASNYGVDLIGLGHAAGKSTTDAFGEYIADSVTLAPGARNRANPIDAFRGLRNMLDQTIVGGNDFAQQVFNLTGSAENYLNSTSRANSGYSSSPGADAMASSIKSYLIRAMAPGIVAGKSAAEAFDMAQAGSPHAHTDFILGLSDVMSQYFTGPSRKEVSDYLAARAFDRLRSGQRMSVQDLVYDAAYGLQIDENNLPTAIRSLRDWYNGNVAAAERFAQPAAMLLAHYKDDENMPDVTARALVSKALTDASVAERRGLNPNLVFQARNNVGTIYRPDPRYLDATGNPVRVDPLTGKPAEGGSGIYVISPVLDDRTRRGPDGRSVYGYTGDDLEWRNRNNAYRRMYQDSLKAQADAQRTEMRRVISEGG